MTKLQAFADNKINVDKLIISLFDRVENAEGKGDNAGYQHFLLFPLRFPKLCFLMVVKSRDYVVNSLCQNMAPLRLSYLTCEIRKN